MDELQEFYNRYIDRHFFDFTWWKERLDIKKIKAHEKWAAKHQLSKDYEAINDGGTFLGKSKKQLDKAFDKLPGQNDKA